MNHNRDLINLSPEESGSHDGAEITTVCVHIVLVWKTIIHQPRVWLARCCRLELSDNPELAFISFQWSCCTITGTYFVIVSENDSFSILRQSVNEIFLTLMITNLTNKARFMKHNVLYIKEVKDIWLYWISITGQATIGQQPSGQTFKKMIDGWCRWFIDEMRDQVPSWSTENGSNILLVI